LFILLKISNIMSSNKTIKPCYDVKIQQTFLKLLAFSLQAKKYAGQFYGFKEKKRL
jgi:hypothetical protein